ncbi:hypothetical protein J2S41_001944 [Catenuloplanes atrovinosus]|uniref:Uncharacterized protein n=1 Tax=Catenuloplanes atrovinosus TaxID=137266 RepID=A0AAE3YNU5_9ACTN|nr:hypothetical protein [Catenuloplanes atrovinosus]
MLTATRNLLTSLEPLPYRERMRTLARWARTAPDRADVCADLREQGPYERRLALHAALVARDRDGIAAAAHDPMPSIRASALGAAVRAGVAAGEHADRPQADRRRIHRALRRHPRPETADALIAEIRARFGDHEAAALLPACGPDTVRALLPELEHAIRPVRLVRRHPGPLLDRVRERLGAATAEERVTIWADAAPAVLRCDPADALDLLERYPPGEALPGPLTAYGVLAAHAPDRVAALLTAPARAGWLHRTTLPPGLLRRLAPLPTDVLAAIGARIRDNAIALAALLDAVPPRRRGPLYDRIMADVDTATAVPAPAVMEVLPEPVRVREATRVLTLPRIREQEQLADTWSAYLAWPDARAALDVTLRSGDADERARGYALLVTAARRSRDPRAVADVLARLGRLRNEQDPVRASALAALRAMAPLLTAGTADALTRLTTDAAEARDASAATTTALSGLAADVLRHHVDEPSLREWALFTIDLMSGSATVPVLRRFDSVLRRGQEAMVFARLRGWVENGVARARYGPLFALTHALGRRARHVPELQELLGRATGPDTLPSVARTAISLWLDDPRTRAARVAAVLDADGSAVTLHEVWSTICVSRTDLLDRVLHAPIAGRFVERGTRWVPRWAVRPERWLPRQQARFVELSALVAADAGQGVQARAAAVRAAAAIPGAGRDLVLRYVDDPEVAIAEAALGALAGTDRPDEALPVLLRYAGGDRARVALYAAGRAARYVPPPVLADVLGPVLAGPAKVTSRKEAVRLLARFGPPDAMATLLDLYTRPDQHRDVRAAIVSAARQGLGSEASWTILRAAVGGSREERRAVLGAYPYAIAERHRARYGAFLLDAARADDAEVRRAAFARLATWSPWLTGAADLIVDRLTDTGESLTHLEAAGLLRAGGDAVLGTALERLIARDAADDRPGDPLEDRPARRRVQVLAAGASARSRTLPPDADRSALTGAARWLAARAGFTGTGVVLLVDLGRLDNLDEVAGLCAGRPVLAAHIADQVGRRMRGLRDWSDPEAVARLARRGDVTGGLFAVRLVQHGAGFGWTGTWRTLLLELRAHPDPDVREAAYGIDMS